MNIKEAKQEIIRTVAAYRETDESGVRRIPVEKQRPIFLIGPPGVGKTAIMQQVAHECGINLVAYTMTHHTRQSAIGLPFVVKKNYGGEEYSVTEYTMSEIVAACYEQIERSGIKEGILFLDEINCVSETLAPAMLQFLQYKTFGPHHIPEGFLIVTAGNPPEYNRSVRDFDVVTLDRIRHIRVEEDFDVWKEYARSRGIHGAIMAYLEIKQDRFYRMRADLSGRSFVTPRGWEDLSLIMDVYERRGEEITARLAEQYLQEKDTAEDFILYYELYKKYRETYHIADILCGEMTRGSAEFSHASFDGKLSLISLLVDSLNECFRRYGQEADTNRQLLELCRSLRGRLKGRAEDDQHTAAEILGEIREKYTTETDRLERINMIDPSLRCARRMAQETVKEAEELLTREQNGDGKHDFELVREWFTEREDGRLADQEETGKKLSRCFTFLHNTFGDSQEMVLFLTELSKDYSCLRYVRECGNEDFYHYNKMLLMTDRHQELREDLKKMLEE